MLLKEETLKLFISKCFKEEKTKISSDAVVVLTKLMDMFIKEAIERATQQAEVESVDEVDIEHLEKILPQLMLDF